MNGSVICAMAAVSLAAQLVAGCADRSRWEHQMSAAMAAYQQGRYGEAEATLRTAIADGERSGPQDPRLAAALTALAMVSISQGRTDQAEALYRGALRIREQALGPDHEEVATSLSNLAGLYARGPDHPWLAQTLEEYGALLRASGREQDAAAVEARLRKIRTEGLPASGFQPGAR